MEQLCEYFAPLVDLVLVANQITVGLTQKGLKKHVINLLSGDLPYTFGVHFKETFPISSPRHYSSLKNPMD